MSVSLNRLSASINIHLLANVALSMFFCEEIIPEVAGDWVSTALLFENESRFFKNE
jgi:hypothetical protein